MWVLVAGIVVAGGYSVANNRKSAEVALQTELKEINKADGENTEKPAGKKMAFSAFVKQGGSYKCEVKQYMSDVENSGTVYLNGTNMRGEFSTIAEGRTIDTSFIFTDGFMYTWSSALPSMGFKIKADPKVENPNASASGTYAWNADQIGDYNCEAWTADTVKFTLPAGMTFKEIGA